MQVIPKHAWLFPRSRGLLPISQCRMPLSWGLSGDYSGSTGSGAQFCSICFVTAAPGSAE